VNLQAEYVVPFLVGFIPAFAYWWGMLVRTVWNSRRNVSDPFEYDSDVRMAYARFRDQDVRWLAMLWFPSVVGVVVWGVWWVTYGVMQFV
jgi:hypothetical protein